MRVAQGGINFSGGQRQRLAIARAVIRRPAVYLFDDAFSALDVHTEARVRASLREISGNATTIVVTQRISTASAADQVVVIDAGKVVGAGTHESLLADCPTYAEFADSQSLSAGVHGTVNRAPALRLIKRLGAAAPAGRGGDDARNHRNRNRSRRSTGSGPRDRSVVQRRDRSGLPAGITKQQAIAAARRHGDNAFADLLSGMNVVPGRGVDFAAVGRTLCLALTLYLVAALLLWVQARLLNVTVQRTMVALRSEVEDKVHRLPLAYFDTRQRGELLSRITNDVDNLQSSLTMTISQVLTLLLTVVAVLVMMVSISPLLALITLLTVPVSLLATRRDRTAFAAAVRGAVGQHRTAQRPHRRDV